MRLIEIRRADDGELEGFIAQGPGEWLALTVFHGELGRARSRTAAAALVHARGLAALAERWHWFSRRTREWQVVLPQECSPGRVRLAVGYYSLAGVPTATITAADLAAGDRLVLERLAPDAEADPAG
ncbi:MAG TPA: hypothetical protein VF763_09655 [Candidatus Limnocylindrales bacterium]